MCLEHLVANRATVAMPWDRWNGTLVLEYTHCTNGSIERTNHCVALRCFAVRRATGNIGRDEKARLADRQWRTVRAQCAVDSWPHCGQQPALNGTLTETVEATDSTTFGKPCGSAAGPAAADKQPQNHGAHASRAWSVRPIETRLRRHVCTRAAVSRKRFRSNRCAAICASALWRCVCA